MIMMYIYLSLNSGALKVLYKLVHTLLGTCRGDFATDIGPLVEPEEGDDN